MPQICHAHCPSPGGDLGAIAIIAVAGGGAAAAISAFIGDIVLTAGIVVTLAVIALAGLLVHLLRRDRGVVTRPQAVAGLAAPRRIALPPVRQAIAGAYVITEAREAPEDARIAIKRDGATT